MKFSGPWPSSGSMRSGVVSERRMLGPRTSGTGSLSWPTPDASVWMGSNQSCSDGAAVRPALALAVTKWPTPMALSFDKSHQPGQSAIDEVARNWPTPITSYDQRTDDAHAAAKAKAKAKYEAGEYADGCGAPGMMDLQRVATHWPTPTTRDEKGPGPTHTKGGRDLATDATHWPTPTAMDSKSSGASYPKTAMHNPGVTLTDAALRIHRPDLTTPQDGQPTSSDGQGSIRPLRVPSSRVLSASFVEALMGWPLGWSLMGYYSDSTDSGSSETASSPTKPSGRSGNSSPGA